MSENVPLLKRKHLDVDYSYNATDAMNGSTSMLNSNSIYPGAHTNVSSQYLTLSTYLSGVSRKFRSDTYSTIQHSIAVQSSLIMSIAGKRTQIRDSSFFSTICNILPMLQGSTVFAMPFAVITGGLVFIPVGMVLCLFADITGGFLIDCLYKNRSYQKNRTFVHLERTRVYMDIREVAEACWGKFGGCFIHCLLLFYMISHNVVCVVVFGQCVYILFNSLIPISEQQMTIAFSVILIPTLFVRKLSILAVFGFIGVVSIIVGSGTSLVVFVQHVSEWSTFVHDIPLINVKGLPLAVAVLMYSLLANVILPEIEGSMIKPEEIKKALHLSYGISTAFKLLFGLLGALTFGSATNQLVAINVAKYSVNGKYIITIFLLSYNVTNFALLYFVLFEKIDTFIESRFSQSFQSIWVIMSRVLGVILTTGIAVVVPYFGFVAGVVGSLTGFGVTLLCPTLFHLQLKWRELTICRKIVEILMVVVGVFVGAVSVYTSLSTLIRKVG